MIGCVLMIRLLDDRSESGIFRPYISLCVLGIKERKFKGRNTTVGNLSTGESVKLCSRSGIVL